MRNVMSSYMDEEEGLTKMGSSIYIFIYLVKKNFQDSRKAVNADK